MSETPAPFQSLLLQATAAARRRKQPLTTAHLALVMLQNDGVAGDLLARAGVTESGFVTAMRDVGEEPLNFVSMAMARAQGLATQRGDTASPSHLLLAILRQARTAGARCIERSGASLDRAVREVSTALGVDAKSAATEAPPATRREAAPAASRRRTASSPPLPSRAWALTRKSTPPAVIIPKTDDPKREEMARSALITALTESEAAPITPEPTSDLTLSPDDFPLLTSLGRNLTDHVASHGLPPLVARGAIVERCVDVLAKMTSSSPMLVGAPGVGKSAIVGAVTHALLTSARAMETTPKLVIEMSAAALVAGTGIRGALAEKIARLRAELARANGRIVLFIDETHALFGASESADDLATELKGLLGRGDVACIGATTPAEFKKHVERDPALARRFTRIDVPEPTRDEAIAMLNAVVRRLEIHHAVAYSHEAVIAAVDLATRWITERHLPDKAIGVLDLAGARARRMAPSEKGASAAAIVDLRGVAEVIGEQARVPVERLLAQDADRLLSLESTLSSRVIGHREVLERIARTLRRSSAGFRGKRPLGTFLLLGPTGVGKTETARAIADALFPHGAMSRFDMSEMSESHSVARLIGAPPGYIGHDEGGQLTEAVRRRPYQLVLLDEIEKAHVEVLLALLPLLDEGHLTDARGRTVDFTNTVIVMTSNLGGELVRATGAIGFGAEAAPASTSNADRALAAARRALPPELWNRIDEPVYFGPLGREDVAAIARKMIEDVGGILRREHGVVLEHHPECIDVLVRAGGFDAALGARPMRRTIARLVEAPLAEWLLSGDVVRGDRVVLIPDGDRIGRRVVAAGLAAE